MTLIFCLANYVEILRLLCNLCHFIVGNITTTSPFTEFPLMVLRCKHVICAPYGIIGKGAACMAVPIFSLPLRFCWKWGINSTMGNITSERGRDFTAGSLCLHLIMLLNLFSSVWKWYLWLTFSKLLFGRCIFILNVKTCSG